MCAGSRCVLVLRIRSSDVACVTGINHNPYVPNGWPEQATPESYEHATLETSPSTINKTSSCFHGHATRVAQYSQQIKLLTIFTAWRPLSHTVISTAWRPPSRTVIPSVWRPPSRTALYSYFHGFATTESYRYFCDHQVAPLLSRLWQSQNLAVISTVLRPPSCIPESCRHFHDVATTDL